MRKNILWKYGLALALLIVAPLVLAYVLPTTSAGRTIDVGKNFDPQASLSANGRNITLSSAISLCEVREKTSEMQAAICARGDLCRGQWYRYRALLIGAPGALCH